MMQKCQEMVDASSKIQCGQCSQLFTTTDFFDHVNECPNRKAPRHTKLNSSWRGFTGLSRNQTLRSSGMFHPQLTGDSQGYYPPRQTHEYTMLCEESVAVPPNQSNEAIAQGKQVSPQVEEQRKLSSSSSPSNQIGEGILEGNRAESKRLASCFF